MTDITPIFNEALRTHNAPPVTHHHYSIDRLNEFLKEAYSINARIADLTSYLRAVRPAYLSTAPAPRQSRRQSGQHTGSKDGAAAAATTTAQRHLTDTERAAIDAEAKAVLRQLNAAVTRLAQTEQIRQDTASHIALRKRGGAAASLGALGRWAAGGMGVPDTPKSEEEAAQEADRRMEATSREGVIWFLQDRLRVAGEVQAGMMDVRISREVERSKSVLYKSKVAASSAAAGAGVGASGGAGAGLEEDVAAAENADRAPEMQLSQEQLQLFAQENQDMLKHYEDTLSQVRNAEKSLIEISELQSTLVANLQQQNEHIDQLVQDSYLTTENVGRGNKELKRASERPSTARVLFHSTCAFCAFLIVWDLVF